MGQVKESVAPGLLLCYLCRIMRSRSCIGSAVAVCWLGRERGNPSTLQRFNAARPFSLQRGAKFSEGTGERPE
jgi:hypothetical protein